MLENLKNSISELDDKIAKMKMLNELINAFGLSFGSNHSRLNQVQNEDCVSALYNNYSALAKELGDIVNRMYDELPETNSK